MTDEVAPQWSHQERDGFFTTARTALHLDSPLARPNAPATTLWLDVVEDEDALVYRWSVTISEEEANWGDPGVEAGESADLDEAKSDCYDGAVQFLLAEGYTSEEICRAVSVTG